MAGPVLLLCLLGACGDDPTGPDTARCDVADLQLTVRGGGQVVLDWEPACPVAVIFVEAPGGSDTWQIRSDRWDDDPDALSPSWNTIAPPVRYGVTPPGAEPEDYIMPEPLVDGVEYRLGVLRVLDSGLAVNSTSFTLD